MLSGLGTDIIEIDRIRQAVKQFGQKFLSRVYSGFEVDYCSRQGKYKFPELAVRFAAKEAYAKALGTGMRGISWRDIEVRNNSQGKPYLVIRGKKKQGLCVSLSHNHTQATAVVTIEK